MHAVQWKNKMYIYLKLNIQWRTVSYLTLHLFHIGKFIRKWCRPHGYMLINMSPITINHLTYKSGLTTSDKRSFLVWYRCLIATDRNVHAFEEIISFDSSLLNEFWMWAINHTECALHYRDDVVFCSNAFPFRVDNSDSIRLNR